SVVARWIHAASDRAHTPIQGWKLHVSANVVSAEDVLRRVLPILRAEHLCFKVARSRAMLHALNQAEGRLSQIGKFLTIYPNDDDQAVRLAAALDQATRELQGPAIPSDRALRRGSLVHYRYGGFSDQYLQTPLGEILPALIAPDGARVPDRRLTYYQAPEWAADPFSAAGFTDEGMEQSRCVGDVYLIVTALHRSPRGMVYLAIDLRAGRRCILKRALPGAMLGTDGLDARDRLRHEARVLERLGQDPAFPTAYDLLQEGDDLYLAMEDMDGVTLEAYVGERGAQGCCLPNRQVEEWGTQLAEMLGTVHAAGFVYRDLKSPNVIVGPGKQLRLIDFELAHEMTAPTPIRAYGTRGYVSPQQAAGEAPRVEDDIYSVGALLYFMATGAEPSLAPRQFDLPNRPIRVVNPPISPALESVIVRCLDPDPEQRFASMAALGRALQDVRDDPGTDAVVGCVPAHDPEPEIRRRCRALARRLGDTLCATAQPSPFGEGKMWLSSHYLGAGIRSRDINVGSAGPVLALADLVSAFGDARHGAVLAAGARHLLAAPRLETDPLPGLYIGEAGIGAALLRAGQALGDRTLIAAAEERGRLIAAQPHISPDLFNGTGGRLLFHLLLWDETSTEEHLRAAMEAGEALLVMAEGFENDLELDCGWPIPPGYGDLSGRALLGYAHGAAGIADVLLDLFEVTGDRRFLTPARGVARRLAKQTVRTLDDGSGRDWPEVEGGIGSRLWCHGAAGIGRFLLHATQLDLVPDAADLTRRAAWTVVRGARAVGPVQCHGLAGNIEFALDARAVLADHPTYDRWLWSLAQLLEAFASEQDGLLMFPSESPATFSPDYMVGYAGIAMCLLRLGDPERPHQLSRRGFRRQPSAAPTEATL
ncbi:MAG: class IV lanthionine synthetase LanL, partial [Chloroflexota bacterium]